MVSVQQFQEIVSKLLDDDNDIRKQAEEAYEAVSIAERITYLLQLSRVYEIAAETRSMCLVLLRRLLSNSWEDFWPTVDETHKANFRNELLAALQHEPEKSVKKKICDVISEVARNHLDEEGKQSWPQIGPFLFELAGSGSDANLESTLSIIESIPSVFGVEQSSYLQQLYHLFDQSMQHSSNAEIRTAGFCSAVAFITDNDEDVSLIRSFQGLSPILLVVCASSAADDNDKVMQSMIELCTTAPKLFRKNLADLCGMCLGIVANTGNEDNTRQNMLEVLVSMCEAAAPMMRKDGSKHISQMVEQCLMLMMEIDEEEAEWAASDDADSEDTDSNATTGETSLDRIANALGGKAVLPICLELVPKMLQSVDWKARHAGLLAFSSVGEGCHKQMESIIGQIIDYILPFLKDQEPRVRYAACNALGQFSSDFSPQVQKKFHQKIVGALVESTEDYANPRVQAHALAALVNFFEECPKTVSTLYLEVIMQKLQIILVRTYEILSQSGKKLVLEQVVTTIASVADSAQEKFMPYYDGVIPCLKHILESSAQHENLRLLRGKAIECISLIGLSVGKEKFAPDANEIMQLLLQSQTTELADEDPQVSYMIAAWTRVCKLLGKEFAPYLPLVMPQVLKTASIKPEVTVLDTDEAKVMDDDTEWQFVNLGDQSFGIKTAGLEDKATACQMLVCYARELKEAFVEYVEPVAELMISLLKFYFHDGVRMAAAECLPHLLECAKVKGPQFVGELWNRMLPELLKSMALDPDNDALSENMASFAQCVEILGGGCLTASQLEELMQILDKYLTQHFDKQEERSAKRKDEDYDEEVEKELIDEDDDDVFILGKISDIVHALMKTHKESMVPLYDRLLPHIAKLVGDSRPYRDRQWGICFFDDLIEFAGANSIKYAELFLNPMRHALVDTAAEVRQAAAYGFGVMAMYGGNVYAQTLAETMPLLIQMVEAQGSRDTDAGKSATENAIAAIAKILKFNNSMIDVNSMIPKFVSWLPVYEDTEECPHTYGYLADLLEANHPSALGENSENLPRIMGIIGDAIDKKAFEEDDSKPALNRLLVLVNQVKQNTEMFQICLSQLSEDQRNGLLSQL